MAHKRLTQPPTDRISGLPVEIIHNHILTSLPDKDVKIMSSLSKTWYHISTSFPYLVFDESCFVEPCSEEVDTDMYLNYVTRTLERFHNHNLELDLRHIRKLEISITFFPRVAPFLDRWIELALQHGVEEFNLKITNLEYNFINEPLYDLPQSVFAAKSIKVASIMGCSLLRSFPNKQENRSISNLQKLLLGKVVLDEISVSNIISSCTLLKELNFMFCLGDMNHLRISNLPKLEQLGIFEWVGKGCYPLVDINAPSLQILRIHGCPKAKHLDLNYDLYLQDILSRLPNLRSLHLSFMSRLTKFKISIHTLNELGLWANKNLVEIEIDAPNLVSSNYCGEFNRLLSCSSKNNVMIPWNRVSTHYNGSETPLIKVEEFLVRLIDFFSKKKNMETLFLSFSKIRGRFSFKKLHERVVQPAENIDNLELTFYSLKKADCTNLLDGVLWICHPQTLSIDLNDSEPDDNNNYIVKHICKLIINHCRDRNRLCQARRRWIHRIREVMSVDRNGTEDFLPMDRASIHCFSRSYGHIKFIFKW